MPTIPLFNPSASPDAWHQVRAPGGYECWRVQCFDFSTETHFCVEIWEGDSRNDEYRRRFERFIRNPTRELPPVPSEFVSVRVDMYQNGKRLGGSVVNLSREVFAAQSDRLNIRAGASSLINQSESCALVVNAPEISASLELRPRAWIEPLTCGQHHRAFFVNPVCEARGDVKVIRTNQSISLRGDCFNDHLLGDRPVPARTFDARVIAGERGFAIRIFDAQVQAVEFNSVGAQMIDASGAEIDWCGEFPRSIRIGNIAQLSAPVALSRVHATYSADLRGVKTRALCTIG